MFRKLIPADLPLPLALAAIGAAAGTFTLAPNETATVVPLQGCQTTSRIFREPKSQHAAQQMSTSWIVAGTNEFIVNHASNQFDDSEFDFFALL